MYILGIGCYYHDASAALIKDGSAVSTAELNPSLQPTSAGWTPKITILGKDRPSASASASASLRPALCSEKLSAAWASRASPGVKRINWPGSRPISAASTTTTRSHPSSTFNRSSPAFPTSRAVTPFGSPQRASSSTIRGPTPSSPPTRGTPHA